MPQWEARGRAACLPLRVTALQAEADPASLPVDAPSAPGPELRVTPIGGWARVELLIPWPERSGCARVWQQIGGEWAEVEVEAERRDEGRCVLELSSESGILGELVAGHPLELSWGRRPGKQRAGVSGASAFNKAFDQVARSR